MTQTYRVVHKMARVHVLNIPVTPQLLEEWRSHLAPDRQPLFLTPDQA